MKEKEWQKPNAMMEEGYSEIIFEKSMTEVAEWDQKGMMRLYSSESPRITLVTVLLNRKKLLFYIISHASRMIRVTQEDNSYHSRSAWNNVKLWMWFHLF